VMNPPAFECDSHALTASYEALREHVFGSADCRHSVRGLALLMREGMAAWMKSVAKEPMRETVIPAASHLIPIPEGIERNLIDIMANMAFTAALENVA
jgi:hypothetical protein